MNKLIRIWIGVLTVLTGSMVQSGCQSGKPNLNEERSYLEILCDVDFLVWNLWRDAKPHVEAEEEKFGINTPKGRVVFFKERLATPGDERQIPYHLTGVIEGVILITYIDGKVARAQLKPGSYALRPHSILFELEP